jgi:hypothetical protein
MEPRRARLAFVGLLSEVDLMVLAAYCTAGIRVIDFTHALAGPTCTYHLSLLGVDVIKVERLGTGDEFRWFHNLVDESKMAAAFMAANAGKRSISVDTTRPEGKAVLRRLLETADVFVQNFRPGSVERMGFGYEECKKINPNLIYCGVVTLTERVRREAVSAAGAGSSGDAGDGFPVRHGVKTMQMGGKGGATGAGRDEEIAYGGEDRDEPLQASQGAEPLHRPLTSSQRQVLILGSVVEAPVRAMCERWHDLAPGSGIRSQLVGNHASGRATLLLEKACQQAPCRLGIVSRLDDLVEDITVLIDRSPQPIPLAADRDDDLIQVPDVAVAWHFALEATGVIPPEFQGPAPDRLVGDDDAALQQHFFHQTQAQGETKMQPHHMGDDRRWEPMALVADGWQGHAKVSTPRRDASKLM